MKALEFENAVAELGDGGLIVYRQDEAPEWVPLDDGTKLSIQTGWRGSSLVICRCGPTIVLSGAPLEKLQQFMDAAQPAR